VVNSASYSADALAPNAIASIFGTGLSYTTVSVGSDNIINHMLPVELAGVHVYVDYQRVPLYYVSPKQINFLIPGTLLSGPMDLFVVLQGTAGPHVQVTLHDAGPGLFQWEPGMIASTHADGSIITSAHPAKPGETVVLYGTGLGRIDPELVSGQISMVPAQIQQLGEFRVMVAGATLDSTSVQYAGVTPGIPGLYQVNLRLPAKLAPDPEIRIAIGDQTSPPSTKLPVH
jgi:uncharacterized protein (TIGR03437 family)